MSINPAAFARPGKGQLMDAAKQLLNMVLDKAQDDSAVPDSMGGPQSNFRYLLTTALDGDFMHTRSGRKLEAEYGEQVPKVLGALEHIETTGEPREADKAAISSDAYAVAKLIGDMHGEQSKALLLASREHGDAVAMREAMRGEKLSRTEAIKVEQDEKKELRESAGAFRMIQQNIESGLMPKLDELAKLMGIQLNKGSFLE